MCEGIRKFIRSNQKIIATLIALLILFQHPISAQSATGDVILKTANSRQVLDIGGSVTVFYDKTVAQLISEETTAHNINPRMILTILQRESSAITQTSPSSETRRAWPMFYNYDERMGTCLNDKDPNYCSDAKYGNATYLERADDYGGLGHQLAYSINNFQRLYNLYDPNRAGHDATFNYHADTTIDGTTINPSTIATKVLYAYTPHLSAYDTSSNFWTYYSSWWGSPNGGAYNKNDIFSDANFVNSNPMSAAEINNWLVAQGSWLGNYTIPEYVSVPYPGVEGAVENTPPPVSGDFNGDRVVDVLDLSMFASYWGQTNPGNTLVDMNQDGVVDIIDLSILASYWN